MNIRSVFYPLFLTLIVLGSCASSHSHEEEQEDEHHHESGIHIEPATAAEFGINVESIETGTFRDAIKTSGIIESSTSDIYTVSAKKSGIVSLSAGLTPGSMLASGQNIGNIRAEGIQGGDVNKAALANLETAAAEYERLKALYEDKLVTASVFREAERAYKEAQALAGSGSISGQAALISPVAGTLQSLTVSNGQFVEAGEPVAVIVKNSSRTLTADLPVRLIRHLPELESANFIPAGSSQVWKLSDLEGKKISGSYPAETGDGYIPVKFSFSGNPLSTPSGVAEVYLLCGQRENVLSVPRDALVEIQGNKYVYVAEDDHEYEKRLVTTGATDGERIEILSGLEAGERVVTQGATVVRMAEISAIAPPAHTHNH